MKVYLDDDMDSNAENNPVQDMTLQEIAHAVTQIERAGVPLKNSYHNLNFWRGGAD